MNAQGWRIVFAGTPAFAVPALDALVQAGMPPVAVYTRPDRPSGRGRRVTPGPVKRRAVAHGIPVHQPGSLDTLDPTDPDLLVVAAYGLILPPAVLRMPRHGCINVHASLLPRWRGAAPVQHALLAGDAETGITIMQMDEGLDTGPVLLRRRIPVGPDDTAGSLHDKLSGLGAEALIEAIDGLTSGSLVPEPQPDDGVTWAPRIGKRDARLDFTRDAPALERQVRAFDPRPVAEAVLDGETVRVWRADTAEGAGEPGRIIDAGSDGILVACGEGALRLLEVQLPGGRRIMASDLANARRLAGRRFG